MCKAKKIQKHKIQISTQCWSCNKMNKAQSYLVFLVTLAVTLQDKEKGDIRTEHNLLDAMELKHFFFLLNIKLL